VLFDKIAFVYFFGKYIYILALEMASPRNQHCANCLGTLSFPMTGISYRTLSTSSLTVPSQTADSRQLTVASIDKPSANFDLQ